MLSLSFAAGLFLSSILKGPEEERGAGWWASTKGISATVLQLMLRRGMSVGCCAAYLKGMDLGLRLKEQADETKERT